VTSILVVDGLTVVFREVPLGTCLQLASVLQAWLEIWWHTAANLFSNSVHTTLFPKEVFERKHSGKKVWCVFEKKEFFSKTHHTFLQNFFCKKWYHATLLPHHLNVTTTTLCCISKM